MKPIALLLAIVTLSLAEAADIKITTHSDHIIQVELRDPKPTENFDAAISPDATSLLLRSAGQFRLVPLDRPLTAKRIESAPAHDGRPLLFLPDGGLVANFREETRLVRHDAPPRKVLAKPIHAHPLECNDLVAVSNKLLIGGDGDSWGGTPGNILRHDLEAGTVTKGVRISSFAGAFLSPTRRHIAYEFGDEESNFTHLYDIRSDTDSGVAKIIGEPGADSLYPLGWTPGGHLLVNIFTEGPVNPKHYLALIDPATPRLLWRQPCPIWLFPSGFIPLNATHALLLEFEKGSIHRLDLENGKSAGIEDFRAMAASLSPDGKQLAILHWPDPGRNAPHRAKLILCRPDGSDRKTIAQIPRFQPRRNYRAMGVAPPVWSPRGDRIVVPEETGAWMISLPKPGK